MCVCVAFNMWGGDPLQQPPVKQSLLLYAEQVTADYLANGSLSVRHAACIEVYAIFAVSNAT